MPKTIRSGGGIRSNKLVNVGVRTGSPNERLPLAMPVNSDRTWASMLIAGIPLEPQQ